jgi:hypothetical protein
VNYDTVSSYGCPSQRSPGIRREMISRVPSGSSLYRQAQPLRMTKMGPGSSPSWSRSMPTELGDKGVQHAVLSFGRTSVALAPVLQQRNTFALPGESSGVVPGSAIYALLLSYPSITLEGYKTIARTRTARKPRRPRPRRQCWHSTPTIGIA